MRSLRMPIATYNGLLVACFLYSLSGTSTQLLNLRLFGITKFENASHMATTTVFCPCCSCGIWPDGHGSSPILSALSARREAIGHRIIFGQAIQGLVINGQISIFGIMYDLVLQSCFDLISTDNEIDVLAQIDIIFVDDDNIGFFR